MTKITSGHIATTNLIVTMQAEGRTTGSHDPPLNRKDGDLAQGVSEVAS